MELSMKFDVVVAGDYYFDLVFTGLPGMPELGTEIFGTGFNLTPGGAYNTVITLHKLGLKTGWFCDFGNDHFSDYVLRTSSKNNLDQSLFQRHNEPVRRVTASISFPEDRAFVSYADDPQTSIFQLDKETYQSIFSENSCDWLLMGMNFSSNAHQLVDVIHHANGKVMMDCAHTNKTIKDADVQAIFRKIDLLVMNLAEAQHLTDRESSEDALHALSDFCPCCVIKMGEKGAIAIRDGKISTAPAVKVNVVDTTGAGDSFNAGLLLGLIEDVPFQKCLQYGAVCGSLSVTYRGAEPFFDREQIISIIDNNNDSWSIQ
jgi:sugar/nucleoside kinase (ribokinase family)